MGYCIELGYMVDDEFEIAFVTPFYGGSNPQTDNPVIEREAYDLLIGINDVLEAAALQPDTHQIAKAEEDGEANINFRAEIDITTNYSKRIREVANMHLSDLRGKCATEGAAMLMPLITGLGDETNPNYWKPADGNIKRIALILLEWAFQHPNAVFQAF